MSDPKSTLRQSIAGAVAMLSSAELSRKSAAIIQRLKSHPLFANARTVMAYDSTAGEVNTQEILAYCIEKKLRLALPRMERKSKALSAHSVTSLDALPSTHFGFREPPADAPQIPIGEIDLIIVPGVAFDVQGHRLGRGGGYYDRFLARSELKATRCALAFESQLVPMIPCLPHDQGVDLIFTEDRTIAAASTGTGV